MDREENNHQTNRSSIPSKPAPPSSHPTRIPMDKTTAPEMGKEPVTETYWPNLRKLVEADPSVLNRLQLECAICYSPMYPDIAARSVSFMLQTHPSMALGRHEICRSAAIIPCGHMYCLPCIARMQATQPHTGCPTCKTPYRFERCQHNALVVMPTRLDEIRELPKTLNEEGGKAAPVCFKCALARCLEALDRTAEVLMDRDACPRVDFDRLKFGGHVSFVGCSGIQLGSVDQSVPDSTSHHALPPQASGNKSLTGSAAGFVDGGSDEGDAEGMAAVRDLCDIYAKALMRQYRNHWGYGIVRHVVLFLDLNEDPGLSWSE